MRDCIVDREYMLRRERFNRRASEETLEDLASGQIPSENHASALYSASNYMMSVVEARYSGGDPIEALIPDFEAYLSLLERYHGERMKLDPCNRLQWVNLYWDSYNEYLCALSGAVLLRLPAEFLSRVAEIIDARDPGAVCKSGKALYEVGNNRGKDALMDALLNKCGSPGPQFTELRIGRHFKTLLAVIEAEPEKRPALMKKYLNGWLAAHIRYSGFRALDKIDENFGYTGYWSFESALMVKLWNIDDSSFRDHPHYPGDLVHW
ncbi:hypothetical protein D3C85_1070080 [compost metagenome]